MKVGLFIPCYVDQCYPNVGLATVDLLERHGVEVDYPQAQTCCGHPMANSGLGDAAPPLAQRFSGSSVIAITWCARRAAARRWSAFITAACSPIRRRRS